MKKGVIIGIASAIVIIGIVSVLSQVDDTTIDTVTDTSIDDVPELPPEPKGTNYSVNLSESMSIAQAP